LFDITTMECKSVRKITVNEKELNENRVFLLSLVLSMK
jgi:hypothetical protein